MPDIRLYSGNYTAIEYSFKELNNIKTFKGVFCLFYYALSFGFNIFWARGFNIFARMLNRELFILSA